MSTFKKLIEQITNVPQELQKQVAGAVNQALTIRNWLIGFYIVEYEQEGEDRASYGENLLGQILINYQALKESMKELYSDFVSFISFILELGNGFCLEARQKRILIGENYYFIDLVFYHRIMKCHVLLELKIGAFEHGDIGQLNTYLNYFKDEISEKSDNPPVGILMVAEKDLALVKYATAGMSESLFVQKYMVNLPDKEQLENYIKTELNKLS